jgi:TrmH family RNA methyltransferase
MAFGAQGILLSHGCADPLSPKVIRSSAGTSLQANIYRSAETLPKLIETINQHPLWSETLQVWGTCGAREPINQSVPDTESVKIYDLHDLPSTTYTSPMAFILGNEGQGIDDQSMDKKGHNKTSLHWLTIPIEPSVESLNVATSGSIILSHLYNCRKNASLHRSQNGGGL